MVVHECAFAQFHAAMRAAVNRTVDASGAIPPEDQFLAHAGYANRLFADFIGFQDDIPLIPGS